MNDSDGDCPYYCSSEEEEGGVEPAEIDIGPLDDDLIPEASQGPNLDGDDDYTIANQSIPVVTNQRDDPRDEEAVDDVKQDVESRPQRKEKRRRLAKEPRNAAILSPQIGNKV